MTEDPEAARISELSADALSADALSADALNEEAASALAGASLLADASEDAASLLAAEPHLRRKIPTTRRRTGTLTMREPPTRSLW